MLIKHRSHRGQICKAFLPSQPCKRVQFASLITFLLLLRSTEALQPKFERPKNSEEAMTLSREVWGYTVALSAFSWVLFYLRRRASQINWRSRGKPRRSVAKEQMRWQSPDWMVSIPEEVSDHIRLKECADLLFEEGICRLISAHSSTLAPAVANRMGLHTSFENEVAFEETVTSEYDWYSP